MSQATPSFTNGGTEAQREEGTCSLLHSKWRAESEQRPGPQAVKPAVRTEHSSRVAGSLAFYYCHLKGCDGQGHLARNQGADRAKPPPPLLSPTPAHTQHLAPLTPTSTSALGPQPSHAKATVGTREHWAGSPGARHSLPSRVPRASQVASPL